MASAQGVTTPAGRSTLRAMAARLGLSESFGLYEDEENSPGWQTENGDNSTQVSATRSISLHSSLFSDSESSPGMDPSIARTSSAAVQQAALARGALEEKISSLAHDKKLLKIELDCERQRYNRDMVTLRTNLSSKLKSVQTRQSQLAEEVPQLRERLHATFAEFEDLRCSNEMYQELCALPAKELTLRQHVLIKVYETVGTSRLATEGLRLELQETKDKINQLQLESDERSRETETTNTQHTQSIAAVEQRYKTAQDEIKRLEDLSNEYRLMVQQLKDKGDRFDVVQNRVNQAEQERAVAREQADQALEAARIAREDLSNVKDSLVELQQQVQLLQVDKTYLARQAEQAQATLAQSERAVEREQDKVNQATSTIEKLRQRLEEVATQGRSVYEERLETELKAHEQRNKKEVSELKEMHAQVLEREIRGLEREKHNIQEQLDRVLAKLTNMEAEKTVMLDDHKARTSVLENQVFELRNSSKIKAFEIQQVSSAADQRSQEVAKLKLENVMLDQKLQVLKDEFYALESKSNRQVMDANARLRAERTKVSTLEALQDIDYSQQQNLDTGTASTAMSSTASSLLMNRMGLGGGRGGIGTLTQRLGKATEELHEWQGKCEELQQDRDAAVERCEGMKKRMAMLNQPQSLIIESLSKEEENVKESLKRISVLEDNIRILEQRLDVTLHERDTALADMGKILDERHEMQKLVEMQKEQMLQHANQLAMESKQLTELVMIDDGDDEEDEDSTNDLSPEQSDEQPTSPSFDRSRNSERGDNYSSLRRSGREKHTARVRSNPVSQSRAVTVLSSSRNSGAELSGVSDDAVFEWHQQDDQGIPLPKWYRRLRQPNTVKLESCEVGSFGSEEEEEAEEEEAQDVAIES